MGRCIGPQDARQEVKYLLDTCTLSYLASKRSNVIARFNEHQADTAVAAVAWQEKHYGLLRLGPGNLRDGLQGFLATFGRPVLPYDARAALWHAAHRAKRRKDGNDAMVAAIAMAHGLTVVTSNEADFGAFEVPWVNWLR